MDMKHGERGGGKIMNKIKKIIFILSLAAAAGITYTIVALKNIPESFDWNLEEDEDENY
jgi:hypothetical protein